MHCDLDCFYAQVERERLGLPQDACVAVVQWSMVLAVSYPARKYGITRGSNIDQIRKLSNNAVTIVPVETIGIANRNTPSDQGQQSNNSLPKDVQANEKVSLARYRKASSEVFAAMAEALNGYDAIVERASIDEAYIDVTVEVERRLKHTTKGEQFFVDTVVVGDSLDLSNEINLRLAHGADIAAEVRKKVFEKCNYTVSAGISVNKLLSKFASAKNKPNQQTILPVSAIREMMAEVPLNKLRGLGGKLGKKVQSLNVKTAGEAANLSMNILERELGKQSAAEFVYRSVRGIDETPVVERGKAKSLLAAKSFKGEHSLAIVESHWLPLLADELTNRLIQESEMNRRDANTLTVSFRAKMIAGSAILNASRSTAMPQASTKNRAQAIASLALTLLKNVMYKEKQFCFPISFVGLTAGNMFERAAQDAGIDRFFNCTDSVQDGQQRDLIRGLRSDMDREEEYQKRLQKKADRDLALRLHRQENSRGIKKSTLKSAPSRSGGRAKVAKGKSRGNSTTIDMFFRPKGKNA